MRLLDRLKLDQHASLAISIHGLVAPMQILEQVAMKKGRRCPVISIWCERAKERASAYISRIACVGSRGRGTVDASRTLSLNTACSSVELVERLVFR